MKFYENEKYDVFIAYYGNNETGSEKQARQIFNYINHVPINQKRFIRAYFHPSVNPYGSFEETPLIVARTPLFLLVADSNIPTTPEGQLPKYREDGTLRNLFEEVRAFHDSKMYKSHGGDSAAKVFICDNMDPKEAERLHTVFSGRTSLSRHEEILEWIKHFYTHTYNERLLKWCEYTARSNRDEFLKGNWLPEAKEIWESLKNEDIGRCLLIYYKMKSLNGCDQSRQEVRKLENELYSLPNLSQKTLRLLSTKC